jgi:hypothetical protein
LDLTSGEHLGISKSVKASAERNRWEIAEETERDHRVGP